MQVVCIAITWCATAIPLIAHLLQAINISFNADLPAVDFFCDELLWTHITTIKPFVLSIKDQTSKQYEWVFSRIACGERWMEDDPGLVKVKEWNVEWLHKIA